MDIITASTLRSLVKDNGGPHVSVFLPTHRSGRATAQGPIRLGNLLDRARTELKDMGLRRSEVEAILSPAADLVDRRRFWQYQEEGLALFASPGRTETFRLPVTFAELVVVSDAFHIKPLWPVVSRGTLFALLALSRNEVRLMWADRFRAGDITLPDDMPVSLAEALWYDDPEKQLQHHAADRVGQGRVVAAFHGHGGPEDQGKAKLETFLRAVDKGVRQVVDSSLPLVLAGVQEITARFRRVSQHAAIVDETVVGNPDDTTRRELHHRALEIMRPRLERAFDEAVAAFAGAGDLAVTTIPDAVSAALAGRVAVLFLPLGVQAWGRADPDRAEVLMHDARIPGDRDLLDLAGTSTWSTGGEVYAVAPEEVPGGSQIAARLRF